MAGGLRVVEAGGCVDEVELEARVEAVCPVTGIVDVYRLMLRYTPPRSARGCRYLEALSVHDYLAGFRGIKILQEELAARIAEEVCRALGGGLVRVTLEGSHGPVAMRVTAARSCGEPGEAEG
ncbi:MAG: hypothetical protein GXO15_01360 [Crenarchaeota archaeon]|nr:hypothetical protein [Thermoproteota archaeon]